MPQPVDLSVKTSTPPTRQNPGAACEECRRRKVRCDRQQPACGLCLSSGVQCQVTTPRPPRGPKRGYLKALQARIATLEGSLLQQQQQQQQQQQPSSNCSNTMSISPVDTSLEGLAFNDPSSLTWDFAVTADEDATLRDLCRGTGPSTTSGGSSLDEGSAQASTSPIRGFETLSDGIGFADATMPRKMSEMSDGLDGLNISNLMQADLDQLYFDRVHLFAPILHQRRYFSWARNIAKAGAQSCLRYAMWTLAASVSAHYQNIGDSLYRCTKQALEALDPKCVGITMTEIEKVQAWLLLAIHEFMCVDFSKGWESAGRAFTLIQLNWHHYTSGSDVSLTREDWVDAEQKRRTFWLAYCLDRFISIRNNSPVTFSEQNTIRLPAPEVDFQNEQPTVSRFLSEAITAMDAKCTSAFAECIVVATVVGRALNHGQQSVVDNMYIHESQGFWEQHEWINSTVVQRMDMFNQNCPTAAQEADPMLLFISMMWRTTVLYMYQLIKLVIHPSDEKRSVLADYTRQSTTAAKEIVNLTNKLSQLNSFKVHPFTPIPLSLCAEFFVTYHELGDTYGKQLQEITEAMHGLMSFSNLGPGFSSYAR
ncbi:fungal-specific transcription factor domain-containing protein [Daldinia decipiens]|uniref:fungal-specific transcription factor domain-containing protein n=1 Tax=Daldinia decipiens TaxID=326647 RepID=UPI0020C42BEE|nr:fungal-specific transcription factor domain-containing protein [Daldinia decipiens]KAI1654624.1 fungal-specific transcription factor domain-containing protein [Daldinia decipiens]